MGDLIDLGSEVLEGSATYGDGHAFLYPSGVGMYVETLALLHAAVDELLHEWT